MITNADMEAFADLLVVWLERDLKAGLVKSKTLPADVPEALPQSDHKR
jgi:hypothetical protein